MNVSDLRREYEANGLRRWDLHVDPLVQFQRWFDEALAADMLDANAMTLATADADGAPSARIVLIKGVDEQGVTFFTDYDSDKGRDLDANPRAAVEFYWPPMHRQVRMRGLVTKVSREESEQYFASRPRGAQISAAASNAAPRRSTRSSGTILCLARLTGAGTGFAPKWSSSGRAGPTGCTTDSGILAVWMGGIFSASRLEEKRT